MKCALEMKIAVVEKITKEEEEKRLAKQREMERKMQEYLNHLSYFNKEIESALLEGNGLAEILIDKADFSNDGYYQIVYQYYYSAAMRKQKKPYWTLGISNNFKFNLTHYCDYLRQHCYEVEVIPFSYRGYSSTGKSTMTVSCYKLIVKIPN